MDNSSENGRPSGQFPSWLSRKPRNRKSLFPILVDRDPSKPHTAPPTASASPRPSTSAVHSESHSRPGTLKYDSSRSVRGATVSHPGTGTPSTVASITFAPHPALLRSSSITSDRSTKSSPALAPPEGNRRHRSSTFGSTSGQSEDTPPTPPFMSGGSGRNSTSTAGRSSLSNLFGLSHRFRQNDMSPRHGSSTNVTIGPSGNASLSNSLTITRDSIALPEREEGETAIQYLERVEDMAPRSQIPCVLSKSGDEFRLAVMRSFMRKFVFFGDPLDMAIRKLLMEIDLPKETQQIDRVMQSFADRYHECNPGIFNSASDAYFIAFSILMLQTDFFNQNNKRKMTKPGYVKNTSIEGISNDVLECFYDNIIYTPFIRVEEDQDVMTMRRRKDRKTLKAAKAAKAAIKNVPSDPTKKPHKQPLDPYTLIFESRLDTLRPPLREGMNLEDPYTYLGSLPLFDRRVLRNSKIGVIQIESSRSRPDAFMSRSGIENPTEAKVGLVDLPIDKVGLLWRKDPKKKTARSPWQEWGVILTGVGLYFYKNSGWVKNYIHQYESHIKHGGAGTSCLFKPPIASFKPDYTLPTDHAVALQDETYKRHKNAFCFFGHNGFEEVFLADSDSDLDDWLAKLNNQAACKAAGISQRGPIGGQYNGQRQRAIRRHENSTSSQVVQTPTGEVTIQRGSIDPKLVQQMSEARKNAVQTKMQGIDEKLVVTTKHVENELRDARHLLLMAPIQQKTRDILVHAADRCRERLKQQRVEYWRLKCHRDILSMDLDEEQREEDRRQAQQRPDIKGQNSASNTLKPNGLDRSTSTNSATTNGTFSNSAAPAKVSSHAPTASQESNAFSNADSTADEAEDFHTPPESANRPSTPETSTQAPKQSHSIHNTPSPQQKSPNNFLHPHRESLTSNYSHTSRLTPRGPRPSLDLQTEASSVSEMQTIVTDDDDVEDAAKSELDEVNEIQESDAERPITPVTPQSATHADDEVPKVNSATSDRGRKHHSHHSGSKHRRNRKGSNSKDLQKEDGSGSKADDDDAPTGLIRDKPLFTVHGKKASIVTFGGEWSANPEETLQRVKAATSSPTGSGSSKDPPNLKSPLSRMTTADDGAVKEDAKQIADGDFSVTPTPGSPNPGQSNSEFSPHPPRNSSIRAHDRRAPSIRTHSSSAVSSRSVNTTIEDDKKKPMREAAVEA
ncbi:hypothetical protein BT63DRAFT_365940 [Microthyrium microscopicum]|uniref:SEC7 domain-containing protein n=1 Tax=Microthyrium microscopicum TaxID=703497 RepID=A0A6A6UQQ2_9PEZI|nr:hypothetical protein BT63DRAFT_365940 [Microthyrium microscopicum]